MRNLTAAFLNAFSCLPVAFALASLLELAGVKFDAAYTGTFLSAAIGTFLFAKFSNSPIIVFPNYALVSSFVYIEVMCGGAPILDVFAASIIAALIGVLLMIFKLDDKINSILKKFFSENLMSAFLFGISLFLILQGLTIGKVIVSSPFAFAMTGDMDNPVFVYSLFGTIISFLLYAKYKKFAIILPVILIIVFSYLEGYIATDKIFLPPPFEFEPPTLNFSFDLCRVSLEIFLLTTVISSFYQCLLNKTLDKAGIKLTPIFSVNIISPFLSVFMLTPSLLSTIGMSCGATDKKVSYITALFFIIFIFFEPLAKSLTDFTAIYAPALVIAGIFTFSKIRSLFSGNLGENIAGAAFILLFPITCDIATALMCSIILLIIVNLAYKED